MDLPPLTVLLAGPRGFCAGVRRAIEVVEQALEIHGAPIYVRHEIVHNRRVVEDLERKGAIFVDEIDAVPPSSTVIFSAHGVPKCVPIEAERRGMHYLDATCPLVSKVHNEAQHFYRDGYDILLIGHEGHPEVLGTMGQLPDAAITLIQTQADAHAVTPTRPDRLAYLTQTTLSVDDTAGIVGALKQRFPHIRGPHRGDICYATTNRQDAVKAICNRCDAMIVVGSEQSSNSKRLVEVAQRTGCEKTILVECAAKLDWQFLGKPRTLGLTAGASTPEELVEEVIGALRNRFDLTIEDATIAYEDVAFNLPRALAQVS